MIASSDLVHFWTDEVSEDEVSAWDPDREPARYASGRGHALYELFARLARSGRPVSLGARPPRGAHVLVTVLECVARHDDGLLPRKSFELSRAAVRVPRVVVIRNDMPFSVAVPRYAAREIAPNIAAAASGRHATWLPLLPQRGLRPRDARRGERVDVVAIKAMPRNLPDVVTDGTLARELAAIGTELRVDTDATRWPDFGDVDVALGVRKVRPDWDDGSLLRKPPTKLVNAWVAGAIPVLVPEPSHAGLVEPGRDAVVVAHPDDIVAAVARLRAEPGRAQDLFVQSRRRGTEFSTHSVLEQWEQFLWSGTVGAHPLRALATAGALGARVYARRARRRAVRAARRPSTTA